MALCLGTAQAEGPEAWASLHDGRLTQSMDRNPAAAIAIYETLLAGMPQGDLMRGDLLYWLGRARLAGGDAAGATETLGQAQEVWSSRSRARALLSRLQAQRQAVRSVPYDQDFSEGTAPWVRGWNRGQDSDLEVDRESESTGPAASWRVEVRQGEGDFLAMAVATDGVRIQQIEMQLRASNFPAYVRITMEDADGKRWTSGSYFVQTGEWNQITVGLSQLVAMGKTAGQSRISGDRVRWITLHDVTAELTDDRGENRLLIDDLSLR